MVKQISDNEIYLLIKYIKIVPWRAAKRLSYIKDARCLKVNEHPSGGSRDVAYGRTDMTKLIVVFTIFANPPHIRGYAALPQTAVTTVRNTTKAIIQQTYPVLRDQIVLHRTLCHCQYFVNLKSKDSNLHSVYTSTPSLDLRSLFWGETYLYLYLYCLFKRSYHSFDVDTRWRIWLRHCATSRRVAGSIPDGAIGIFHSFRPHYGPWD